MGKATLRRVVGASARLADAGATDAELIRRFAADGDQEAFAAVVRRHTGLVLGVCRRALPSAADADDACQAVFVVLARKAKSVRWQASAANWLYSTARRVSKDARVAAERRARHEGNAGRPESAAPIDRMTGRELLAAVEAELDRLPALYREPLVLGLLEGLSREDVAARLGLPAGTVKTRLERGRKKLADALTKRGVTLGSGLLALAAVAPASATPPQLLDAILAAAGGRPSAPVAALARGITVNTWNAKAALTLAAAIALAALGLGQRGADVGANDTPGAKGEVLVRPAAAAHEPKALTITGTVLGPDGKPVAGAVLRMPDVEGPKNATVKNPKHLPVVEVGKTDADGKFAVTVPPLPAGSPEYRQLVAAKPGFGPDGVNILEAAGAPVTLKLVADDVPVKGRVTDLEGKPVAKAKVELWSILAGDLGRVWEAWPGRPELALGHLKRNIWAGLAGIPTDVVADADGRFEVTGVGRGRVLAFAVEGAGIETAGCRVVTDAAFDPKKVQQPAHDTMPGGAYVPGPALYGPTFVHAAKPAQPVVGVVTDSKTGKPIAGVQIDGHPDGPHWYENGSRAFTDADGKFTLHGVAKSDRVRLMVFPTAKQPYFQYSTAVAGKPGLTEIPAELKLTRGVLVKGRVTETGGKPVVGAGIHYTALADNTFYAELMNGRRGEAGMAWDTDADGRFEMVVLPGSGIVTAQGETRGRRSGTDYTQVRIATADLPRAHGRDQDSLGEAFIAADGHIVTLHSLSGYKIIDPKPTDDAVEVSIVFDRGRAATGKVVGADGKPAAGVTAYRLTECYDRPQELKDGTFTAIALDPAHPRTVLFVDAERKRSATAELKGDERDVTLKLEPWGKLTGRLLGADGKPLPGLTVSVHVKNSIKYGAFAAATREKAVTAADGTFALELPAGPVEYGIGFGRRNKFLDVGRPYESKGWTVKPGETIDAGEFRAKGE